LRTIHWLLALIAVFFLMVLLLLSIHVEFLAMIFLIIYIGAIAILFLFVIMIFNLKALDPTNTGLPDDFYQSIVLFWCFVAPKFYFILCRNIHAYTTYNDFFFNQLQTRHYDVVHYLDFESNDILVFSELFYTELYPLFILLGFIVLNSRISAIALALSTDQITN
jgi:NADH:ubiquinone oxidoreductase subunit 6 (subunit J)